MFDPTSDSGLFSDVRQDFLFACCLHGLVMESNIESLLGETPMQTLPSGGRYEKNQLVSQFLTEPDKIETYIGELEDMNGNVGAIAMAISEVCCNVEDLGGANLLR
jgi:mediator of RNA polymerase II transcription subunit 5